jgi:biopolymer transport protein ExbD
MKSLAINTHKASMQLVLIAMVLLAAVLYGPATSNAQELRKGISVEMATSNNATPVPAADNADAWIIAVTADGRFYFGTKLVTPKELLEEMIATPRKREQQLYIKADARVPYAKVEKALEAGKVDMFESAVLLTTQPESPALGTMVRPKGLEVILAPRSSGLEPVVLQLLSSGQKAPLLKINNNDVPIADLQTALNQALQNRSEKVVQMNADPQLSFAQVAHVIDACRSVGATVIVATI